MRHPVRSLQTQHRPGCVQRSEVSPARRSRSMRDPARPQHTWQGAGNAVLRGQHRLLPIQSRVHPCALMLLSSRRREAGCAGFAEIFSGALQLSLARRDKCSKCNHLPQTPREKVSWVLERLNNIASAAGINAQRADAMLAHQSILPCPERRPRAMQPLLSLHVQGVITSCHAGVLEPGTGFQETGNQ